MDRTTYKNISRIAGEIIESPENNRLTCENPEAVENFLISICLSCLYPRFYRRIKKYPDGNVNAGSFRTAIPAHLEKEYPFPAQLWLPGGVFSALLKTIQSSGPDFIGTLYESMLDRRKSDSHRKNEGVFYTPGWLVRDVIEHTLKPVLLQWYERFRTAMENCDSYGFICLWDQLASLRILDPACGWGTFLLEAYRELERFYLSVGSMAGAVLQQCALGHFDIADLFSEDYAGVLEESEILTRIKKTCHTPGSRILRLHLWGMDLDRRSVTMAGNLLLAAAGVEKGPAPNIYTRDFIDWMEKPKVKFDLVLGNPPYFTIGGGGRGRAKGNLHQKLKKHPFFGSHFRTQSDVFYYFITGGIDRLKEDGVISYVVPSYWLENEFGDLLRGYILDKCQVKEIIRFAPLSVFSTVSGRDVRVDSLTFRAVKKKEISKTAGKLRAYSPGNKNRFKTAEKFMEAIRSEKNPLPPATVDPANLALGRWDLGSAPPGIALVIDGKQTHPLGDVTGKLSERFPNRFLDNSSFTGPCKMGQGQETGLSSVFLLSENAAQKFGIEKELLVPNLKNSHIRRYRLEPDGSQILMTLDGHDIEKYPRAFEYLKNHRQELEARQRVITGKRKWWAVSIPQNYQLFSNTPKILVPYRAADCRFAMDRSGYFNDGGDVRALAIKSDWSDRVSPEYLLGFLNSRFTSGWYARFGKRKGRLLEFFTRSMSLIPFRVPDKKTRKEVEELALNLENLYSAPEVKINNPAAKKMEERLDRLIFRLYGMTGDEFDEKVEG